MEELGSAAEGGERELKAMENEVKKIDEELDNVAFLDQKQSLNQDFGQSKHSSKYKRWVLDACGFLSPPISTHETSKQLPRRTRLESIHGLERLHIPSLIPKVPPAPTKPQSRKLTPLRGSRIGKFIQCPMLEDFKVGLLFRPEIVNAVDDNVVKANAAYASEKRELEDEDKVGELQNQGAHNQEIECEQDPAFAAKERLVKACKEKFISNIYGKKKGHSAALFQKVVEQHSHAVYDYLSKRRAHILKSLSPKPKDEEQSTTCLPSTFDHASPQRTRQPPSLSRSWSVSKPHSLNVTKANFAFGRMNDPFFKTQLVGSRSSSGTQSPQQQASLGRERKAKADALVGACFQEVQKAEENISHVAAFQKQIHNKLHGIGNSLTERAALELERYGREHIKFLTEHKHLFIYGKKGSGRYLNADGKDLVKMSDMMMKSNPKYPFLRARFSDILVKEPS